MYRYSIIACARWETAYIAEWLAYHEAIGFDHIYLYCNDDDPAALKAAVVAATSDNPGFVSFTHFPGQGRQADMYLAALDQARDATEWVTFLDIDEFLVLRDCDDIHRFMEPFRNRVDSVHFNWIYFGNSGFVTRPPGSVLRQYTSRSAMVNANTKHLSRMTLLGRDRLSRPSHPPFWHALADPVWSGFRRVNVLGADMAHLLVNYPANNGAYLADREINQAVLRKAVINHYALKSEADFLLRVERGIGGQFSGQVIWRQSYESGGYRDTLAAMSQAEDTYLRDFSLRREQPVATAPATPKPPEKPPADPAPPQPGAFVKVAPSAPRHRPPQPAAAAPAAAAAIPARPTIAIREYTRRRVIVIRPRGDFANLMIQYMAAMSLAALIDDCTVVNAVLPDWNINHPNDTDGQRFRTNIDYDGEWFLPDLRELAALANRTDSIRIVIADYMQRIEFFQARSVYNQVFPRRETPGYAPTKNDLVISIRAGEILRGIAHYPLMPIAFYEQLIATTGLDPVFVGQLKPSDYANELRRRFPAARFIESRGARTDFDVLRSASNIVVSVSTFAWLAAWLSNARTIILPLNGFLNPMHCREIDLLPVDDFRYRFFLFPLNYGVPEKAALALHERLKGRWKEISRNQVALLKTAAPFLRVRRESDGGQKARAELMPFDDVWYVHEHLDAAMEISEGWFETPLQHYLEVGRLRGYTPTRPQQDAETLDPTLANLALGRPASQSSLSEWSAGATREEDAAHAVNGDPGKERCFHTALDQNPWWTVDLGKVSRLHFVRVFNRNRVTEILLQRASPLVIEASNDGAQWRELFRTAHGEVFGGYGSGRALRWRPPQPVEARFVRLTVPRREYLHLAEVEIYGRPVIS